MSENKQNSRAYKKILIFVPLLLLFVAVMVNQNYLMPIANDPLPANDLELLGYGLGGGTITLSNAGDKTITILNVTYDGHPMTRGIVGGTTPMFAMSQNESSLCLVASTDLIFPQVFHWNMDTGGLCIASIPPGGVATIYLGVFSNTNSSHLVMIVTQEGNYSFIV